MTREVDASVANVLDSYRVTLNVGESRGVSVGDTATIWRLVQVTDPDNGDRLGEVRIDNVRMRILEVHERFSVAHIPRETSSLFPSLGLTLPRKRITGGPGGEAGDEVVILVGDAATVYVDAESAD